MKNRIKDAGFGIQEAGCDARRAVEFPHSFPLNPESCIPYPINPNCPLGSNPSQPPLVRGGARFALPLIRGSWRGFGSNGLSGIKGFTLVELLVVVSLVAIFASMLFGRVWFYQEMAEKAAMQQVTGALQTALILQYGHRMASNQASGMKNISTENPMDWLAQKPGNYAGEFNAIKPGTIEPGNWAFDLSTHELIYVPDHVEYFVPARDGVKWIRFRTRFDYEAGYGGKGEQVLTGVIFAPVEPYQWSIKEK